MNTRRTSRLAILGVVAVIWLVTLACGFSGTVDLLDDGAKVDVKISEAQLNRMLRESNNHVEVNVEEDELLEEITSVDFQPGKVIVYGTTRLDNGDEVEGNYELSVGTEDGVLQVQVTAVNVPGIDMDDPRVRRANRKAEDALRDVAHEGNSEVRFESVNITEEEMRIVVDVELDR